MEIMHTPIYSGILFHSHKTNSRFITNLAIWNIIIIKKIPAAIVPVTLLIHIANKNKNAQMIRQIIKEKTIKRKKVNKILSSGINSNISNGLFSVISS